MKPAFKILTFALIMSISLSAFAQKIKLKEGSITALKGETTINVEFKYDDMGVGKFPKEKDYIEHRRSEMNARESGSGDKWANSWVSDRKAAYEPKFIKLFTDYSKMSVAANAKYTMVFHTTFTEPGYNVGVWRGNALINATATIVETTNRKNIIAVINITGSKGKMPMGSDFATSWRIAECYARAGREIAQFLK